MEGCDILDGSVKLTCKMDFGIPRYLIVVNFHGNSDQEYLGIPNCNNSNSKKLEMPRNSKFMANSTWNSQKVLGIPTQSTDDFP